ncbi:MAG: Cupin 2 conserved barrel domain protein [Frankiales bacterium]|jgi:quercetin dioxygenase-like cupin family protein|nr:Cupin 2 conserved barrel domain protein [Frankiales bacterium]
MPTRALGVPRSQGVPVAFTDAAPGITRHVMHGESMTIMRVAFAAGAVLPEHRHEHEQYTHVVRGRLSLSLRLEGSGTTRHLVLAAGDGFAIPPWAAHSMAADEESETVEMFVPRRDDIPAA